MSNVFQHSQFSSKNQKCRFIKWNRLNNTLLMVAKSCYIFLKVLNSMETSCLNCLRHKRTLKLDMVTAEIAKDFTKFMRSFDEVHEMRKFKVVERRHSD